MQGGGANLSGVGPGFDPDKIYLLDGGFSSHLEKSLPSATDNPLWGSGALHTDPEEVRRVHEDYLKAGAMILTTNTYQSSIDLFQKHLEFEDKHLDPYGLYRTSVDLCDEAYKRVKGVERFGLVAGSIGPYGACQGDGSEYTGDYVDTVSAKELERWHFQRIKRLMIAGVDLFAVETIPSIKEALAILNVISKFPGAQCWISFQCRDGGHTAKGEPFDQVVKTLIGHDAFHTRVVAVGVNCTDPRHVSSLLNLANKVNKWEQFPWKTDYVKVPYVVYPNHGDRWDAEKNCWDGDGKADDSLILDNVEEWMKLGANIIGGCCTVGPELIAKIRLKIEACFFRVMAHRDENAAPDPNRSWAEVEKSLKKKNFSKKSKKKTEVDDLDEVLENMTFIPGHMNQLKINELMTAIEKKFEGT